MSSIYPDRPFTVLIAESPEYSARGIERMRAAGWNIEWYRDGLERMPEMLRKVDGAIVRFGIRWDADALRQAAPLHFIAVPATGTDHIDRTAAKSLGIEVVSLAGHPGLKDITATPEHAFGLMLALLRKTIHAHASVIKGEWNRNAFFGSQLSGKTVGVVGLGRTGSAFARMASACGARVCYVDPHVRDQAYIQCTHLTDLARQSDIVTVHAVLDASTRELLNKSFFEALKPGAFLINTARGALLDEAALLHALDSGRLAGAALDVLCDEPAAGQPLDSAVVAYARQHDHVIITPHIGGATFESIEQAEWLLAGELVELFGDCRAG
jgi:D-3-phosphoglycerate dehydrogenase / 2-oxoglutarate reductase